MKPQDEYKACGGVVLDERSRVLLLERDVEREGKMVHEVRLPKGHVDAGESDEQTALREVAEETGYQDAQILADLGEHTSEFDRKGKHTRRHIHYYLMRVDSPNHTSPKPVKKEEALFRVIWADDLASARGRLTYDEEREFAERAMRHLAGQERRRKD